MSFRKRNVALVGSSSKQASIQPESSSLLPTGVRPSPLDGRPTTSTGVQTLDESLGGHGGLPLGHSLLIEENGTTDFAGAVLRFYAAEGVVQGHQVHVVGVPEQWGRELPGVVGASTGADAEKNVAGDKEKMKIAWRYERLGEFGAEREGPKASPLPNRTFSPSNPSENPPSTDPNSPSQPPNPPFIHSFDLTKRLTPPSTSLPINYIPLPSNNTTPNPYPSLLHSITHSLTTTTTPPTIHRLIIPTLLSPLLYAPSSTQPTNLLPFLHSLRSLLRQHPTRLTMILTFPLSLHPRNQGLTRWIEHLMDGVLELAPFPYSVEADSSGGGAGGIGKEDKAQGMLKVHKLPVGTEKGMGSGGGGEDLTFSLSRRRFVIRPFWLPPVEGEGDGLGGAGEGGNSGDGKGSGGGTGGGMPKKGDIDF